MAFMRDQAMEQGKEYLVRMVYDMDLADNSDDLLFSEFERYRRHAKTQQSFIEDIYGWWKGSPFTALKLVGLRLSALHASSANTERIFSTLK